jgi:hypothetical protein
MRQMRRLDLVWEGKDVGDFNVVADAAKEAKEPVPEFVKRVLRRALGRDNQ